MKIAKIHSLLFLAFASCFINYAFGKGSSGGLGSSNSSSNGGSSYQAPSTPRGSPNLYQSNGNTVQVVVPKPVPIAQQKHTPPQVKPDAKIAIYMYQPNILSKHDASTQKETTKAIVNEKLRDNELEVPAQIDVLSEQEQLSASEVLALSKNNELSSSQIGYFNTLNEGAWQIYVQGLSDALSIECFHLYALYQFPTFQDFIKTIPGYDDAMVDIYNRLDSSSPTFDQQLFSTLEHTPAGHALYECLNNNAAVSARIEEQGKEFAVQLMMRDASDQAEEIKRIETNQSNEIIKLTHINNEIKKRENSSSRTDKITTRHFNFKRRIEQLKLALIDQKIIQSKKSIADSKQKLIDDANRQQTEHQTYGTSTDYGSTPDRHINLSIVTPIAQIQEKSTEADRVFFKAQASDVGTHNTQATITPYAYSSGKDNTLATMTRSDPLFTDASKHIAKTILGLRNSTRKNTNSTEILKPTTEAQAKMDFVNYNIQEQRNNVQKYVHEYALQLQNVISSDSLIVELQNLISDLKNTQAQYDKICENNLVHDLLAAQTAPQLDIALRNMQKKSVKERIDCFEQAHIAKVFETSGVILQERIKLCNQKIIACEAQGLADQAHEYLAQNKNEAHTQDRLDALQGIKQDRIALTQVAAMFLKNNDIDSVTLTQDMASSVQAEAQNEIIALANRLANMKMSVSDRQFDSVFASTANLTKLSMQANQDNQTVKSWILIDLGNGLLDVVGAVARGVDRGTHSFQHPIQTCQALAASAEAIGIALYKGRDKPYYALDHEAQVKAFKEHAQDIHNKIEGVMNVIRDIPNITVLGAIEDTTAFVVECTTLGKLFEVIGVAGKFAVSETTAMARKIKQVVRVAEAEKVVVQSGKKLSSILETRQVALNEVISKEMVTIAPQIEKEFFVTVNENGIVSSSFQGNQLNEHLYQLEEYGKCGIKELQNGRIRYYDVVKPSNTPGTMIGRRKVREWSPSTNLKKTWLETLDGQGRVRIIRVETGGPKIHYMFDEFGKLTEIF